MTTNSNGMKKWIVALIMVFSVGGSTLAVATPQLAMAEANPSCSRGFLGFPVWYRGLTASDTDCTIESPNNAGLGHFILHIALNVIEMGMILVGYLAVFFIIFGGFQYLTSQGESANITKAKTTITNAIIGLVIALIAVGIINFIMGVVLVN